ncbi:unnamed protein product [Fraxinus pennsylvanica]|uniref:OPA3-like protein n=1 Tax=Fraxinus pennsylvanica TaxID=56036 RepID=A0AAD2EGV4_9LAMI|nr:unnamed protein product [Fraxinus pennsylvanica]
MSNKWFSRYKDSSGRAGVGINFATLFVIKENFDTQANHRFGTNVQRRIYGHATDVAIRPLNEEKAVQAAADLLGELFVFSVAGVAVICEMQNRSRAEARKEELRRKELEAMKQRDQELGREVELLKHRIATLEQVTKDQSIGGILNFKRASSTGNKAMMA